MKGLSSQQKEILKEIAIIGGLVAVAVIAPNAVQLFRGNDTSKRRHTDSFKRSLASLETRGLIRHQNGEVSLTNEGRYIARAAIHHAGNSTSLISWDKKWRLVLFDIPEDRKNERGHFRLLLKEYGFVLIQKSVYVAPYDCLADVREIAREAGLIRYVSFIETEIIETNRNLITLFELDSN